MILLKAISIMYTLAGFSQLELYHDAILVCVEGEQSCTAYIDDTQVNPAQRMTLKACLNRSEAWIGESEEPYVVLGCSPDAREAVVDITYEEAIGL